MADETSTATATPRAPEARRNRASCRRSSGDRSGSSSGDRRASEGIVLVSRGRGPGGPARRSWRRSRRTQVLPAQEGLQVLHGEDRRHLTTAMCACCRALSPSAARLFRAA